MSWCETCANYVENDPCCECDGSDESHAGYERKQKQTNYDRIISKSPEELAVWLAQQEYRRPRFDGWLPLCNHVMGSRTCHKGGCEKCWFDWLKEVTE